MDGSREGLPHPIFAGQDHFTGGYVVSGRVGRWIGLPGLAGFGGAHFIIPAGQPWSMCLRWWVMGRWLAAVAVVVGLVCAPVAQAAPDEQGFVRAVEYIGFTGDVLPAGEQVCTLLDRGMSTEGVSRFVTDTFGERANSGYYAVLFAQYAAYNLCPRHLGVYGPM